MVERVNLHSSPPAGNPVEPRNKSDPPLIQITMCMCSLLVRAKHPSKVNAPRTLVGMHKCNKPCKVCHLINVTKEFRSNTKDETHKMHGEFSCNTVGMIYLISCNKCSMQYVGQTTRKFQIRLFFFFFFKYPSRLLFIFHGCLSLPYQKGRTTA